MTLQLTKKHNFDVVYDSQSVFRRILDAMSNPTKVVNIEECAGKFSCEQKTFLAVAATLLDNEIGFCVCGDDTLADEIISQTLAEKEELTSADFIFVCDLDYMKYAIENAKIGTLSDPHKSATVVISNDGEPNCLLTFCGPGINGQTTVQVTQTVKDAIMLRDEQHYEYPQGIDLFFVSSNGDLIAVPRLVTAVGDSYED